MGDQDSFAAELRDQLDSSAAAFRWACILMQLATMRYLIARDKRPNIGTTANGHEYPAFPAA